MARPKTRYRGFISYSQKDKAFAKRLHRALERFRLPGGRKLGRFFRDDDELGGSSSLGEALQGAIRDSEDLIVIASPNSAGSKWVNEEVIHFKQLADPHKQVFAVVIDGLPNAADAALECFVPALRSRVSTDGQLTGEPDEPLAPDARKEPFKRLVTKLVAGLEDIPFDDLWQRQKRQARVRAIASIAVIAAIATPLAIWGLTTTLELENRETELASLDTQTQRANFEAAYFAEVSDRQFADGVPEEFLLSREAFSDSLDVLLSTDLDGDGYNDYYTRLEHIEFCGSGGCLHEIFLHDGGTYRSVHRSVGGDLQVLETRQDGVRDVALGFGGLSDGTQLYTLLRHGTDGYEPQAYALCNGAVSYCGLSTVFTGSPEGETLSMVFYPADDPDALARRVDTAAIYQTSSLATLRNGEAPGTAGTSFEYAVGTDGSGDFALVHIWKGTYGIARLTP